MDERSCLRLWLDFRSRVGARVIRVKVEQDIPAPPEAVFALALDTERFPAMFIGCGPVPALRRIVPNSPAGIGATRRVESVDGTRLLETITFLQFPSRHSYSVAGFRPPLAWLVRRGHADWTFSPSGHGTRVCWCYDWEAASAVAQPIAWGLLRWFMRGAMAGCLQAMAAELARRRETV